MYNAQEWPNVQHSGSHHTPPTAHSWPACTRAEAAQTRRDTTAFGRIGVSLSVSDPSIPVDRQVLERETDRLDELLQRKNDEIRLLKARVAHARPRSHPPTHALARAHNGRTHAMLDDSRWKHVGAAGDHPSARVPVQRGATAHPIPARQPVRAGVSEGWRGLSRGGWQERARA